MGVEDNEAFETLVEEWLNWDKAGETNKNFEILNFAVAGYYPLQKAAVIEKAIQLNPDEVYYIATGNEFSRSKFYLAELI